MVRPCEFLELCWSELTVARRSDAMHRNRFMELLGPVAKHRFNWVNFNIEVSVEGDLAYNLTNVTFELLLLADIAHVRNAYGSCDISARCFVGA